MKFLAVAVVVILSASQVSTRQVTPVINIRVVRCSDADLMAVIDHGLSRSATLRALVERLSRGHVIVYIRYDDGLSGRAGQTSLIGAGQGWRFVAVDVSSRLNKLSLLSLIGHELQHAVEIAEAPEVIDVHSFAEFFERVGTLAPRTERVSNGRLVFETDAAIAIGRRVYSELAGDIW